MPRSCGHEPPKPDRCHICWLHANDPRYRRAWGADVEDDRFAVVPANGHNFWGCSKPRPWQYRITAAIPHWESVDTLPVIISLLRLQTERPYILIVDTGSSDAAREALELMRAKDVEIHYLRSHGWLHPSEPVSAAMDTAMSLCRSDYLFATHGDVFPRRRDLLANLMGHNTAAIGYEMSDRSHVTAQWKGMVSHTCTLLHMPTMRRIGATWSVQRAGEMMELPLESIGWPDTETGLNLIFREHGIEPMLIGTEENDQRHVDDNIDHVRSLSSARIYSSEAENDKRAGWLRSALAEAQERITAWRKVNALVPA